MAEEKKPAPAPKSNGKTAEQLVFLLVGLLLLGIVITTLSNYIGSLGFSTFGAFGNSITGYFYKHIWSTWKLVAAIVSIMAFVGVIYNSWQLRAINIEENKIYNPPIPGSTTAENSSLEAKNTKWENVIKYINSNNPSDWRSAIIEADIMLEKLLRVKGYVGESLGDMLKSANKNDLVTLDEAWEAHKARNAIAHTGGDFQLTEREAKRVVALFEKVFKEFQII